MKRGVTLIELTVSMGIFAIISVIAVGAFITVSRMKILTTNMRESQQKIRIANETLTRLARQATAVQLPTNKIVILTFSNGSKAKFEIKNFNSKDSLTLISPYVEGATDNVENDLFQGSLDIKNTSSFTKLTTSGGPELGINLIGTIPELVGKSYYSGDFNLETAVPLEQIQ